MCYNALASLGGWGGPKDPGGEVGDIGRALFGPPSSAYWGHVEHFIYHSIATNTAGAFVGGSFGWAAGEFLGGVSEGLTVARLANPGAVLPPRELGNFVGRPADVVIGEGETLYGIRDLASRRVWWTRTRPLGKLQWRMDQAVLPAWNQATQIETLTVPKGQSLTGFEGVARGQGPYLGGGNQMYIPNVPKEWSVTEAW